MLDPEYVRPVGTTSPPDPDSPGGRKLTMESLGPAATLQRFVFPSVDLCSDAGLYIRCQGAWYSMTEGAVRLPYGTTVQFDTYFNTFSVGKWRRHTRVRRVIPYLDVEGTFDVKGVLSHPHRATRVLWEIRTESDSRRRVELPELALDELDDGQLYLSVRAIGPHGSVFGGGFTTPDAAPRAVRLGAVITTYNRQDYVRRNVGRLATALKDTDGYAERLEMLVVDNGSNLELDLPAWAPVSVVANRNLGGAGGFARGLMHFRRSTDTTHVLFMDDDISFDPEIVFRTIELLSFASDPDLCLAGAMLMEEQPHVQYESGAVFRIESIHPFRPIGSHVDLGNWRKLVDNDAERPSGYGGWWYFAFPLRLAEANPLPVFMRGDDVCFGLRHAGHHTITLNGIGVWHQHFSLKNGPPAFYYESRNLALVSALTSERFSARHLAQRFAYHTLRRLMAMKYDTAAANIAGMRHFLEGPQAWMERDAEQVNRDIRRHSGERPAPLARTELGVGTYQPTSHVVTKGGGLLSVVLLSGHLLPKRLSRRPMVGLGLSAWSPASVLGRERVVYRYEPTGEGFVATRDRARFFRLLGETLSTSTRIVRRFKGLKQAYRESYPEMTSDAFWQRQLG